VQLIRQIYSNADVLIWLGDEEDDSDQAMQLIENSGPKLDEVLSGGHTMEDLDDFWEPEAWHTHTHT